MPSIKIASVPAEIRSGTCCIPQREANR